MLTLSEAAKIVFAEPFRPDRINTAGKTYEIRDPEIVEVGKAFS